MYYFAKRRKTMKIREGKEKEFNDIKAEIVGKAYAEAIVKFAEEWAFAMERLINKGAQISEIADETSREVDSRPGFGISGNMYANAVGILADFWEYGDDLRKWHNQKHGVSAEEKRVVNPSIAIVG